MRIQAYVAIRFSISEEKLLPEIHPNMALNSDEIFCKIISSLGIAIYIPRKILHSHGGTVHVASGSHTGTTFVVTLPHV